MLLDDKYTAERFCYKTVSQASRFFSPPTRTALLRHAEAYPSHSPGSQSPGTDAPPPHTTPSGSHPPIPQTNLRHLRFSVLCLSPEVSTPTCLRSWCFSLSRFIPGGPHVRRSHIPFPSVPLGMHARLPHTSFLCTSRGSCPAVPCARRAHASKRRIVHNRGCVSRRETYLRTRNTHIPPPGGRHFRV